jgi:hypothetical protein
MYNNDAFYIAVPNQRPLVVGQVCCYAGIRDYAILHSFRARNVALTRLDRVAWRFATPRPR